MKKIIYIITIAAISIAFNAMAGEMLLPVAGVENSVIKNQIKFQQSLAKCTPFSFKYPDPYANGYTAKKSIIGITEKGTCKTTEVLKATTSSCEFFVSEAKKLAELATKKDVTADDMSQLQKILKTSCTTKINKETKHG